MWGRAWARRGTAQGRSSARLRRGAAAWGSAGAQRGAAHGHISVGLRRAAAWD